MVLISEGFSLNEITKSLFDAYYVVGLEGPDQSRLRVSDHPLSDLVVLMIGADPAHFPGFFYLKTFGTVS